MLKVLYRNFNRSTIRIGGTVLGGVSMGIAAKHIYKSYYVKGGREESVVEIEKEVPRVVEEKVGNDKKVEQAKVVLDKALCIIKEEVEKRFIKSLQVMDKESEKVEGMYIEVPASTTPNQLKRMISDLNTLLSTINRVVPINIRLVEEGEANVYFFNENLHKSFPIAIDNIAQNLAMLSRIVNKIPRIASREALSNIQKELKRDELLIVSNKDKQSESDFHDFILSDSVLSHKQIRTAFVNEDVINGLEKDSVMAFMKSDRNKLDTIQVNSFSTKSIQDISDELSAKLNSLTVYKNPFIRSKQKKYRLTVAYDSNKFEKHVTKGIRDVINKVLTTHQDLQNNFEVALDTRKIANSEVYKVSLSVYDTEKQAEKDFFLNTNKDTKAYRKRFEKEPELFEALSTKYYFTEGNMTVSNLTNFLFDIKNGRREYGYQSQTAPLFQKYSRRVVGSTFKELVLDNDKHQALFYYSKHCASCKKFLPHFEKLALESYINNDNRIEFSRINNDVNSNSYESSYSYTPRIVVKRGDLKDKSYEYRSNVLDFDLLTSFFYLTTQFNLISEETFQTHINQLRELPGQLIELN